MDKWAINLSYSDKMKSEFLRARGNALNFLNISDPQLRTYRCVVHSDIKCLLLEAGTTECVVLK